MKKWRSSVLGFLAGNAGENVTIGVAFALLIVTPILLINFTDLSLVPFLIITTFATLFGTYAFAQWIGHLRDVDYRRAKAYRRELKSEKRRIWQSKDDCSEDVIDGLVRDCFRRR